MEAVDEASGFGHMAQCVRRLGGKQRNNFIVEPNAETATTRVDRWAKFGRVKF
eukprot:SAG31_NODE_699_length_12741_cov_5.762617_4_plen_53_part_00